MTLARTPLKTRLYTIRNGQEVYITNIGEGKEKIELVTKETDSDNNQEVDKEEGHGIKFNLPTS